MSENTGPDERETLTEELSELDEMIQAGRYAPAAVLANELLDSYPHSAEVPTAIADLYRAGQMWAEAAEFYELAVQHGAGGEATVPLGAVQRHLSAQASLQPDSSRVRRPASGVWWAYAGAAAVVVLGLVIVFIILRLPPVPSASGPQRPQPPVRRSPTARQLTQAPPTLPLPPPPAQATTAPSPPDLRGTPRAALPPVVITRRMIGPVSDRDYNIARVLGSLTWPDGIPMSEDVTVLMDPYTAYAVITFQIPKALEVEDPFAAVLRQSYTLATTALGTDAGINYVTVRALATITTPDKEKRTVVAYRANTKRQTIDHWAELGGEPSINELWSRVFATSWWNPSVDREKIR